MIFFFTLRVGELVFWKRGSMERRWLVSRFRHKLLIMSVRGLLHCLAHKITNCTTRMEYWISFGEKKTPHKLVLKIIRMDFRFPYGKLYLFLFLSIHHTPIQSSCFIPCNYLYKFWSLTLGICVRSYFGQEDIHNDIAYYHTEKIPVKQFWLRIWYSFN